MYICNILIKIIFTVLFKRCLQYILKGETATFKYAIHYHILLCMQWELHCSALCMEDILLYVLGESIK
jgi:hypothetical protein